MLKSLIHLCGKCVKQASSIAGDFFCYNQVSRQRDGVRTRNQTANWAIGSRVLYDKDRTCEENFVDLANCLLVITLAEPTPMPGRLLSSG